MVKGKYNKIKEIPIPTIQQLFKPSFRYKTNDDCICIPDNLTVIYWCEPEFEDNGKTIYRIHYKCYDKEFNNNIVRGITYVAKNSKWDVEFQKWSAGDI